LSIEPNKKEGDSIMLHQVGDIVVFVNEIASANPAPKPVEGESEFSCWARNLAYLGFTTDEQYMVSDIRPQRAEDVTHGSATHPQLLTLTRVSDGRAYTQEISGDWLSTALGVRNRAA
jgi:hypothetical protein